MLNFTNLQKTPNFGRTVHHPRYELHKSKISVDFVYWYRNGEDIFKAVFRKNLLKMSVLYWREPYIYYIHVCNENISAK